jgi:hypothetical protein
MTARQGNQGGTTQHHFAMSYNRGTVKCPMGATLPASSRALATEGGSGHNIMPSKVDGQSVKATKGPARGI